MRDVDKKLFAFNQEAKDVKKDDDKPNATNVRTLYIKKPEETAPLALQSIVVVAEKSSNTSHLLLQILEHNLESFDEDGDFLEGTTFLYFFYFPSLVFQVCQQVGSNPWKLRFL